MQFKKYSKEDNKEYLSETFIHYNPYTDTIYECVTDENTPHTHREVREMLWKNFEKLYFESEEVLNKIHPERLNEFIHFKERAKNALYGQISFLKQTIEVSKSHENYKKEEFFKTEQLLDDILNILSYKSFLSTQTPMVVDSSFEKFLNEAQIIIGEYVMGINKTENQLECINLMNFTDKLMYSDLLLVNSKEVCAYLVHLYAYFGYISISKAIEILEEEEPPLKDVYFCLGFIQNNKEIISKIIFEFVYGRIFKSKVVEHEKESFIVENKLTFFNVSQTIVQHLREEYLNKIYFKYEFSLKARFSEVLSNFFKNMCTFPLSTLDMMILNNTKYFCTLKENKKKVISTIIKRKDSEMLSEEDYNRIVEEMEFFDSGMLENTLKKFLKISYIEYLDKNRFKGIPLSIDVFMLQEYGEYIKQQWHLNKSDFDIVVEKEENFAASKYKEHFKRELVRVMQIILERELMSELAPSGYFHHKLSLK